MTAALEGGGWSAARPGRTLPPGKTRYPLYRRLGGPQGWSGRAENLIPTGIRSRTVQPIVIRYTDWATRPTIIHWYSCGSINISYLHCMFWRNQDTSVHQTTLGDYQYPEKHYRCSTGLQRTAEQKIQKHCSVQRNAQSTNIFWKTWRCLINPLNTELNPICQ